MCDLASRDGLERVKHGLLEVVDEVVGVKVPEGSPEFRNRWMKTQLIRFVYQDAVFMDSDTIVRKPFGPLLSGGTSFGGVANHNGLDIAEQLWSEDERVLKVMGWPGRFRCYINGGMWAFRAVPEVRAFFDTWHARWMEAFRATGGYRDQPGLNLSLETSGMNYEILPRRFNEQLARSWDHAREAVVWHFYGEFGKIPNRYEDVVERSAGAGRSEVESMVRVLMDQPAPWRNWDPIARVLAHFLRSRSADPGVVQMWLDGERGCARRKAMKSIRRRLGLNG